MAVVYREFNADLLYRNAVPLRSLIADTNTAARRFYIYEGRDLDFGYLASCAGYDTLLWSAHARLAAEVGLYHVLKSHPRRTRDPKVAMLFYVPVFEYMSFKLANLCGGNSSHGERMRAASAALHASPHWQASGGRDHFVLSTAFNHPTSIVTRTLPLSKALRCSMAGRYKSFSLAYPRSAKSSWGVCAIEAPYVSPVQASLAEGARRMALASPIARSSTHARPILLHFAGGLDVCCYGHAARCAVGQLLVAALDPQTADVLLRPQMPTSRSLAGPCLLRTVSALLAKYRRLQAAARASGLGHLGELAARLAAQLEWNSSSSGDGGSSGGGGGGSSGSGSSSDDSSSRSTAMSSSGDSKVLPPRRRMAGTLAKIERGGLAADAASSALARLTPNSHGTSLSAELLRQTELEMAQVCASTSIAASSAVRTAPPCALSVAQPNRPLHRPLHRTTAHSTARSTARSTSDGAALSMYIA